MGVERMDISRVYKRLIDKIPNERVLVNESMKKHTSFRIGGPADIMVLPINPQEIKYIIQLCRELSIAFYVMGNGSNLLVRDKGIRGVVIKIADNFSDIKIDGTKVTAQAGVLLSVLSKKVVRNSLKGLEFASGIPGTLGGAVAMNAGAYGGEMKDVVRLVWAIDHLGNDRYLEYDDLKFGYRTSVIQQEKLIVIEVDMQLEKGDMQESMELIAELTRRRREKQPLSYPSAGSTFKRPVGYYAGKLIQDAGLKGLRVGDAQISDLHAGFIINLGNATAKDVIELIETVKAKIKSEFNVEMQPEVKIIGEE